MDEFFDPNEVYDLLPLETNEVPQEFEEYIDVDVRAPPVEVNNDSHSSVQDSHLREHRSRAGRLTESDDDDELLNNENEVRKTSKKRKRELPSELVSEVNVELECGSLPPKKCKNQTSEHQVSNLNNECGVTSRRLPEWPFLTFNTCDGERFYVKFNEDDDKKDLDNHIKNTLKRNLLGESYACMKVLAEKLLDNCEKRAQGMGVNADVTVEENSELWVEKYKPRKYLDLLSDEGVNRSLLRWLKKWDKIVFNKTSKKSVPNTATKNDKIKKFHDSKEDEVDGGFDADGRPQYKIALLCGPPGLGKTTLAHVIADVAGYNAVEVNASDDRSIEAFHTKLEAATQMQSVFKLNKPNCLILDEIDGAPTNSIEYLLKYINGKGSQKGGATKNEKPKGMVKRPIICICNEPYVPSLRQLRQQAYVVHFPHTSSSKLAQRLLEICKKQTIRTDLSTLTILCDKMQNDIRSCISTLHFFKSKNNGCVFKPSDVSKSTVGQKDLQKNLFSMWKEVFQVPLKKNSLSTDYQSQNGNAHFHYSSKNIERLNYLVRLFHSCGDTERLMQGVYENFLNMRISKSLKAVSSGMEWFCWFDTIQTYIKENQNYILSPYLPYAFAAWHFLFSSAGYAKITFPKAGYENHLKEVRAKQILSDVLRGLSPGIRAHTCSLQLLLDILPMFKMILSPSLRPISLKLYTEKEKKEFDHLIDIMIDYNLNYIQQRSPNGTYFFQLDPNIEQITEFAQTERNKGVLSYNMKHFISRELEMERVRRTEGLNPDSEVKDGKSEEKKEETSLPQRKVPNHLQKLTPKAVEVDPANKRQYKDFFGRIVTAKPYTFNKAICEDLEKITSKYRYTYKEGYSNAVKKEVTMAYLL